ncbi:zinc finger matrin-type protein 1-like [Colius striatus]|uniref:zinc finger matrin-type protein 1-like n=1 Tax=Colius striatus TaxID=57412 RepID=UPI002B1E4B49|nr:zinc finger matrin-type protein 1-like [Colius striatus]
MNEVPVTGYITAWILVAEIGVILVSSQGKKHAQKVHLYIQMHAEKDEWQGHGKQVKTDCIDFQRDESGVVDRNKYCNLCNMCFRSPVAALSHYLGKIHSKKLKELSEDQAHVPAQSMQPIPALQKPLSEKPLLLSKGKESTSSYNTRLKINDSDKYCKLCCAPFNSPLAAQEHYVGKKHRRTEARKKILERLGDKVVPAGSSTNDSFFTAVGVGYYMCHICNVIVTSTETYQSRVQGNKQWINLCREAVLANLTKTSKKTYGSFQCKSVDYRYCKEQEGQVSEVIIIRDESFSLSVADSKCSYDLMLAETSTSSCRKEETLQIKCFEEEKSISQELKYKKEAIKQKRKRNSEGAYFGTEDEKQKIMKFEIDLVNEKRSRLCKNKRLKRAKRMKRSHRQLSKRRGVTLGWICLGILIKVLLSFKKFLCL